MNNLTRGQIVFWIIFAAALVVLVATAVSYPVQRPVGEAGVFYPDPAYDYGYSLDGMLDGSFSARIEGRGPKINGCQMNDVVPDCEGVYADLTTCTWKCRGEGSGAGGEGSCPTGYVPGCVLAGGGGQLPCCGPGPWKPGAIPGVTCEEGTDRCPFYE